LLKYTESVIKVFATMSVAEGRLEKQGLAELLRQLAQKSD
jgi:hypothetical protein